MRRILSFSVLMTLVFCSMLGCVVPYDAPFPENEGYSDILVVDGFIVEGESKFKLSKTQMLNMPAGTTATWINRARLWVENEEGQTFEALPPTAEQIRLDEYVVPIDELNPETRYRLRISLDGEEYESTYRSPQKSPPIDRIDFRQKNAGAPIDVTIDVKGRNDEGRYFYWKYEEIWEIEIPEWDRATAFMGVLVPNYNMNAPTNFEYLSWSSSMYEGANYYRIDVLDNPAPGSILFSPVNPWYPYSPFQYCWRYENSKKVLVGSTASLSENRLNAHFMYEIGLSDKRISYMYHTKILQYALGKDAYQFFTNMSKNTDETGSIFAPVPSEMSGNIVCTTSPDTHVIGFIEVSTRTDNEAFFETRGGKPYVKPIDNFNKVTLNYPTLNIRSLDEKDLDKIISYTSGNGDATTIMRDLPSLYLWEGGPTQPFYFADKRCFDCRAWGGIKKKPSFWPNEHK